MAKIEGGNGLHGLDCVKGEEPLPQVGTGEPNILLLTQDFGLASDSLNIKCFCYTSVKISFSRQCSSEILMSVAFAIIFFHPTELEC